MKPHTPAPRSRSFEVKEDCTLMPFLLQALHDQSRTTVKSLLAHRLVQVNNQPTTQFDTPLKPGDTVSVGMNKSAAPFHHSMLKIIHEDEHLIVVEKASGLLSMGTERDKTQTAYYILNEYLKKKDPRNHIYILHRLDKETSGVMMFAKSTGDTPKKLEQHDTGTKIRGCHRRMSATKRRANQIVPFRKHGFRGSFRERRTIGDHKLHGIKVQQTILPRGTRSCKNSEPRSPGIVNMVPKKIRYTVWHYMPSNFISPIRSRGKR